MRKELHYEKKIQKKCPTISFLNYIFGFARNRLLYIQTTKESKAFKGSQNHSECYLVI